MFERLTLPVTGLVGELLAQARGELAVGTVTGGSGARVCAHVSGSQCIPGMGWEGMT